MNQEDPGESAEALGAFAPASPRIFKHILQHMLVQRQIRQDLLQLPVLLLKLLQPSQNVFFRMASSPK